MFLANQKKKAALNGIDAPNPTSNEIQKNRGKQKESAKRHSEAGSSAKTTVTRTNKAEIGAKNIVKQKWSWQHSWAKEILREAIQNEDITNMHTYDEIHAWHPEVQQTDRSKLPSRVRTLRAQVLADTGAAQDDALALEHDRKLYPMSTENYRGEPRWQGSDAEQKLKSDVAAGVHLTMLPADYYSSRPEYQAYSRDTIRGHIYQEIKLQKYCAFRNDKKKKQFVWIKG